MAISKNLRRTVHERDDNRCVVCHNVRDLTLDHILPTIKGGRDLAGNLVTMCKRHNQMKGNSTLFMEAIAAHFKENDLPPAQEWPHIPIRCFVQTRGDRFPDEFGEMQKLGRRGAIWVEFDRKHDRVVCIDTGEIQYATRIINYLSYNRGNQPRYKPYDAK